MLSRLKRLHQIDESYELQDKIQAELDFEVHNLLQLHGDKQSPQSVQEHSAEIPNCPEAQRGSNAKQQDRYYLPREKDIILEQPTDELSPSSVITRTVTMPAGKLPRSVLSPKARTGLSPSQLMKFDVHVHPIVADGKMTMQAALTNGLALPASPIVPIDETDQRSDDSVSPVSNYEDARNDPAVTQVSNVSSYEVGLRAGNSPSTVSLRKAPNAPPQLHSKRHCKILQEPPPRSPLFDSRILARQERRVHREQMERELAELEEQERLLKALLSAQLLQTPKASCDDKDSDNSDCTIKPSSPESRKQFSSEKPVLPNLDFNGARDEFTAVFEPVGGRIDSHASVTGGSGALDSSLSHLSRTDLREDAFKDLDDFSPFIN
jgi:hypothetical protein